jgi:hypothetical protein
MPRLATKLPLSNRLGRWLQRGKRTMAPTADGAPAAEDPLLQVGRLIRQEREARGLNLRQLALDTRISTPVLEALERGWRDRLPEGAYLRTMLPLIEQRLELPKGCLDVALPPQQPNGGPNGGRGGGLLQRFTPGSIDVFSTWQGTVIYGGLTLALIYGVNLQQQQLAAANLLSLRPIPPLPPAEQAKPAAPSTSLLGAYPELRPLQLASRGLALQQLQRRQAQAPSSSSGVLTLNLSQPSRLQLTSEGGQRTNLEGASGELVLQLQAPLSLQLDPAPKAGEVTWNGMPLPPLAKQPGQFRLPQPRQLAAQRP